MEVHHRMRLLLNCDRVVAHVVAAARHPRAAVATETEWPLTSMAAAPAERPDLVGTLPETAPLRPRLEQFIRAVVVGEPAELHLILAVDAVGWSPSGSFSRRDDAVILSQQAMSSLAVDDFRIGVLCWCEPFVMGEWRLEACQADPLLIRDDVLLEPTDRPILLHGATFAHIRDNRVAVTHTYFDDAALIEQVIMRR
jgi:hypothetical protein